MKCVERLSARASDLASATDPRYASDMHGGQRAEGAVVAIVKRRRKAVQGRASEGRAFTLCVPASWRAPRYGVTAHGYTALCTSVPPSACLSLTSLPRVRDPSGKPMYRQVLERLVNDTHLSRSRLLLLVRSPRALRRFEWTKVWR
ncbi:hypothetical protein HETIRDRAFT_100714 [Heterobasidion irregulare TC 32-1]|uniref:Uncharacterized protein n=1 Tax=Heterobasidion irregulare (strain TC 32-1) TaxID=747525 RepID=W4KKS0_HETIT|nr:uncharacterized protein HETIRDRAFT_100714 [Heterobasidion irregulare TC 32-1]ETW85666.1 hypothetical protein HETIRDRAFT_100714 [Heterobasidion irregulare TC 32-1]